MSEPVEVDEIDEMTLETRETDRITSILNQKFIRESGLTVDLELAKSFKNPLKHRKIRNIDIYHIFILKHRKTDEFYLGILNCVNPDGKNYEVKKYFRYKPYGEEIKRLFSIRVGEE